MPKLVGEDTLLARMVNMVAQAQRSRAPVQRLADVVAGFLVPAVVLVAILTFLVWLVWGPEPAMAYAIVNAVAVLIIACPCALGLATPISIMVGMGQGALSGVLVRDAAVLELMERVDTLLVDKTGTLTEGRPELVSLVLTGDGNRTDMLRIAASLERASEHPLALAIVRAAQNEGLELSEVDGFGAVVGKGAKGRVDGRSVSLGNARLMQEGGIEFRQAADTAQSLREKGQTVMFLALDTRVEAILGVADPVKSSTPGAIRALRQEGISIVMLTGDNRTTADHVADELGIDEVHADMMPEDKGSLVGV